MGIDTSQCIIGLYQSKNAWQATRGTVTQASRAPDWQRVSVSLVTGILSALNSIPRSSYPPPEPLGRRVARARQKRGEERLTPFLVGRDQVVRRAARIAA